MPRPNWQGMRNGKGLSTENVNACEKVAHFFVNALEKVAHFL